MTFVLLFKFNRQIKYFSESLSKTVFKLESIFKEQLKFEGEIRVIAIRTAKIVKLWEKYSGGKISFVRIWDCECYVQARNFSFVC